MAPNCLVKYHKIRCQQDTCQSKSDTADEMTVDLSPSEETSLSCNDTGTIVDISEITYYTMKLFAFFCNTNFDQHCTKVINYTLGNCGKSQICYPSEEKGDTCSYTHDDVTSKLKSECLKQEESCTVSVPRKIVNGLETCVQSFGVDFNCDEGIENLCYGKWVEIKYTCIAAPTTTTAMSVTGSGGTDPRNPDNSDDQSAGQAAESSG